MSDLDTLRSRYLQTLVKSLKENVKKTSKLDLDDLILTHCALKMEENCRDKCQGSLHLYTKSITAARIKIDQSTSRNQLFPMIVECVPANEENIVPAAKNNNGKYARVHWAYAAQLRHKLFCVFLSFSLSVLNELQFTATKKTKLQLNYVKLIYITGGINKIQFQLPKSKRL